MRFKWIIKLVKLTAFIFIGFFGGLALLSVANPNIAKLIPIKPYTVLTGSMSPSIATGSLVFVDRRTKEYLTGDVITFIRPDNAKENVTHRISKIEEIDGRKMYYTKGDANRNKDPWTVNAEAIWGKVDFSMPYAGYLISFIKTKIGALVFITLPLIIIIIDEARVIYREINRIKNLKKQKINNKLITLLILLILCLYPTQPTYAYFTDKKIVTDITIKTGEWYPSMDLLKSNNGNKIIFKLNHIGVFDNLNYFLTYKHGTERIDERIDGNEQLNKLSEFSDKIVLGTCSGDICTYHTLVKDIELEATLSDARGNKIVLRGRIENQTDPDEFPSCNAPFGNIIASYDYGKHEIIGVGLLTGSDVVYSLDANKYKVLQCFCPLSGRGIQTNWIRTDDIEGYKSKGFPFSIKSGSSWNLHSGSYAAQNVEYECRE